MLGGDAIYTFIGYWSKKRVTKVSICLMEEEAEVPKADGLGRGLSSCRWEPCAGALVPCGKWGAQCGFPRGGGGRWSIQQVQGGQATD